MANVEIRFKDSHIDNEYVSVHNERDEICIQMFCADELLHVWLDKSTAIKFAKTLRTEINKIQEVDND